MKIELINGKFKITTSEQLSKREIIRYLYRARNFLKVTIVKLDNDIKREALENSGQISIEDAIRDAEKE